MIYAKVSYFPDDFPYIYKEESQRFTIFFFFFRNTSLEELKYPITRSSQEALNNVFTIIFTIYIVTPNDP